ncbi:MAG: DEAD/DEAH box helicase [Gammaproteobacteria bacterium]|nr:DEAD/DEAH box helicase [Gammaproteobacteria bacterium]
MNLTVKDLLSFFKPAYMQRGRVYFEQNMVLNTEKHHGGSVITASVKGAGNNTYSLRIELESRGRSVVDIQGNCSCPVSYNCKHVVAALLHFIEKNPPAQDDMFGLPSDKWLYQLKSAQQQPSEKQPVSNEMVLYLLRTNSYTTGTRFYVETVKARLKKDGSFSTATHCQINPSSKARFMREDDQFAMLLLKSLMEGNAAPYPVLEGESGLKALKVLINTGRCHWSDEEYPAINHAKNITSTLSWHFLSDASQVIKADALNDEFVLVPVTPPCYLNTETGDCGELDCGLPEKISSILVASPPVHPENVDKVSKFLSESISDLKIPLPVKPDIHHNDQVEPVPCLKLLTEQVGTSYYAEDVEPFVFAEFHFDYNGKKIHPSDDKSTFISKTENGFEVIHRNTEIEQQLLTVLNETGLHEADLYTEFEEVMQLEPDQGIDTWIDFMLNQRFKLESDGWSIKITEDFAYQIDEADEWYADVKQGSNEWFKLELGVDIDGKNINLLPFLVNYLGSLKGTMGVSQLRQLPDDHPILLEQNNGRLLHIPLSKVRHILDTLIELHDPDALDQEGKLELSRYQSNQLVELDNQQTKLTWAGGETLRKFGERLQNFEGIRDIAPPATLKAELRDYQREGLNWLQFLRKYDLSGILADDMGLGKTVQTLAHLLVEKKYKRTDLPSLIVAPTSLMVNWSREAARFAPSLSVLVLQGTERKNKFNSINDFDVVLTTYPLLSRDTEILMKYQWHLVILDEAQHIKNPKSKAALTARQLKTRHRLCLTGTPMENHLGELWSQFHFLMPGMLGNEKRFRRIFRTPIEKFQDDYRSKQLSNRIAPFMLRRHKSEVATELPPKTEILSQVELDGAQRDLYETIRVSMHERVKQAIHSNGIGRSQIVILDALLKLRQVCCHPQLLKLSSAKKVKHSAKLSQLMEMLPEMVEEGRRILLFSQFTSMLAIIENEIAQHKIPYVKLTGQTRDRATPIDNFQSGKVPVFLISLKAGGSGLNLTAADTVIHYDPWWNPAAENQATDRAHRIGQDKPVFVYKMITAGTVEEKIVEMQVKKQALADSLFSEGSKGSAISSDDLQALFEPLR